MSRTRKGTITIDAPPQYLAKDDPFNRPDHEIQNWVENTIWRDMHFRGKTLQEIATRDGVGTSYVSRLIDQSLRLFTLPCYLIEHSLIRFEKFPVIFLRNA